MAIPLFDSTFFPDFPGQVWAAREEFITIRSPWDTAGDLTESMTGTNALWAFTLGWRSLTDDQAAAVMHAQEYMGGEASGMFFLEWPTTEKLNLVIGTGTGSGAALTLDLQCRLRGDGVATSGLVITRNFTPVTFTLLTDTGNNYRQHRVQLASGLNDLGATFRATWTAARRRRRVRCVRPYALQDGGGGSRRWAGQAELIETEAAG